MGYYRVKATKQVTSFFVVVLGEERYQSGMHVLRGTVCVSFCSSPALVARQMNVVHVETALTANTSS